MAEALHVEWYHYDYTRLLIEVNRSEKHPQLYSRYSSRLLPTDKNLLLRSYYLPYRKKVESIIRDHIETGLRVIHISVHTFTPFFEEAFREVEVGFLFDEQRIQELEFIQRCMSEFGGVEPQLGLKKNEPYRGADDGFTTHLRGLFSEEDYLGIEVEVSQKFSSNEMKRIGENLAYSLEIGRIMQS